MTKKKDEIVVHAAGLPPAPQEQSYSVELFISQAIEKGLPVETMERLLAMRKQLKEEQAIEAYNRAVAAFQGEGKIIYKNKKVYQKGTTKKQIEDGTAEVRYSYATLDAIVTEIGPLLSKHGLSYRIEVLNEDKWISVTCHLIHELGHSQSSTFRVPIDFGAYMTEQQKYASALTYAKRYAFCDITGILSADEDNDANKIEDEKTTTVTIQPPAKAASTAPPLTVTPKAVEPTKPVAPTAPAVNPEDAKKQRIIKLMRENGLQPTTSTKEGWEDAVKRNLGMELKPENYDKIIGVLSASVGEPPQEPTAPPEGPKAPDASPTAPSSTTVKPAVKDVTVLPAGSMEIGRNPDGTLKEVSIMPGKNDAAQQIIDTFGGVEVTNAPPSATMADWRRAAGDCKNTAEALALIKAMEDAGEKKTSVAMIRGVLAGRKMINP